MNQSLDFGPRESYFAACRARSRAWLMYDRCKRAVTRAMDHAGEENAVANLQRAFDALLHWRTEANAESDQAVYFARKLNRP